MVDRNIWTFSSCFPLVVTFWAIDELSNDEEKADDVCTPDEVDAVTLFVVVDVDEDVERSDSGQTRK